MPDTLVFALRGLFGIAVLLSLAVLFSSDRRNINWRLVAIGVGLQLIFALLVLKTTPGQVLFEGIGAAFAGLLAFTFAGSEFIFGPLGMDPEQDGAFGFVFAFQVLPTIVFFGSLMAVLYYVNLIQPVVKGLGRFMAKAMNISGAESLSVAGNVFIGQTEAPLLVKHYIPGMTRSELMTLMTGGMASIAGGVLASYILFLGGDDPAARAVYASHLLSASIMSAPAAIVMAKILIPETGQPETYGDVEIEVKQDDANILEAAASGAAEGLKLALNVGAMLLAFIALIAMINFLLQWVGNPSLLGFEPYDLNTLIENISNGQFEALSLEAILGTLFAPLAWAIGVETADIFQFGRLLGEKVVVNEFVAYVSLSQLEGVISERSFIIGTYALCGFANFSSIAIQIGGIGGIAPERKADVALLGVQAVIGGALASWMTATIAGVLIA
jgi:concentrative nucleoside transporter, CNT family